MSRNDENNYTLRPLTIDDAEEYTFKVCLSGN